MTMRCVNCAVDLSYIPIGGLCLKCKEAKKTIKKDTSLCDHLERGDIGVKFEIGRWWGHELDVGYKQIVCLDCVSSILESVGVKNDNS